MISLSCGHACCGLSRALVYAMRALVTRRHAAYITPKMEDSPMGIYELGSNLASWPTLAGERNKPHGRTYLCKSLLHPHIQRNGTLSHPVGICSLRLSASFNLRRNLDDPKCSARCRRGGIPPKKCQDPASQEPRMDMGGQDGSTRMGSPL